MDMLAGQVLLEAVSKFATLSHSKIFILIEDGLKHRTFSGAGSLCDAFEAGSLGYLETDYRVDFDQKEDRCAKTQPRRRPPSTAPLMSLPSTPSPALPFSADPPIPRRPPSIQPTSSKRDAPANGEVYDFPKRVKTEPRSRTPSPSIETTGGPPVIDNLDQVLQNKDIMNNVTNALRSIPSVGNLIPGIDGQEPAQQRASRDPSPASRIQPYESQRHSNRSASPSSSFPPPDSAPTTPVRPPAASPQPTTISPFSTDATRSIRARQSSTDDEASVTKRFGRFGAIVEIVRVKQSTNSSWWDIEMESIGAAIKALKYAQGRGYQTEFLANGDLTNMVWVAFKMDSYSVTDNKTAEDFIENHFSRFGRILQLNLKRGAIECQAILEFRADKHVEAVIRNARGKVFGGARFQVDVATPKLKKHFLANLDKLVEAPFAVGASATGSRQSARNPSGETSSSGGHTPKRHSNQKSDSGETSGDGHTPKKKDKKHEKREAPQAVVAPTPAAVTPPTIVPPPATEPARRESPPPELPPPVAEGTQIESRTIQIMLNETQQKLIKNCRKEKIFDLFSKYGDVVDVVMPTEQSSDFTVEFTDVESARKAIDAGKASSGAFLAAFDSRSPPNDAVWLGAVDMPDDLTADSLKRQIINKFAAFEKPKRILLCRSKSQAIAYFSTPEMAKRVLSALRAEKMNGMNSLNFDFMSLKALTVFVKKMTQEDRLDNAG